MNLNWTQEGTMTLADIIKCIEAVAPYLVGGLAINQIIPAILFPLSMGFLKTDTTIKVKDNESELYQNLPPNFYALDYLNLANSIVHNKSEGYGVCRDYSYATYITYMKLIQLNDRKDLEKKVRLASGFVKEGKGHVLVEFEEGNQFRPYETTMRTPVLSIDEIKDYSTRMKNKKGPKLKLVMSRSLRRGNDDFFYPTWKSILFLGGFIRLAYYVLREPS